MRTGVDIHAEDEKDLLVNVETNSTGRVVVKVSHHVHPAITFFLSPAHFLQLKKAVNDFDA